MAKLLICPPSDEIIFAIARTAHVVPTYRCSITALNIELDQVYMHTDFAFGGMSWAVWKRRVEYVSWNPPVKFVQDPVYQNISFVCTHNEWVVGGRHISLAKWFILELIDVSSRIMPPVAVEQKVLIHGGDVVMDLADG